VGHGLDNRIQTQSSGDEDPVDQPSTRRDRNQRSHGRTTSRTQRSMQVLPQHRENDPVAPSRRRLTQLGMHASRATTQLGTQPGTQLAVWHASRHASHAGATHFSLGPYEKTPLHLQHFARPYLSSKHYGSRCAIELIVSVSGLWVLVPGRMRCVQLR